MNIITYPERNTWADLLKRPTLQTESLRETVLEILNRIKFEGDKAVLEYEEKFDKVQLNSLLVSEEEIAEAEKKVSIELKAAITLAYNNIRTFHAAQVFQGKKITTLPGVTCWQKAVAIEKVGLYIPGGTAPLFSTVLMLATPAQIAGCKEIILCTPPNKEGKIHPAILYAAKLAGINRVFKAGGVQAIGAMAYGTQTIRPVDVLAGPGNIYVATAKRLVQGICGIDMVAGPSEVCVIADGSANVKWLAADLLSQAEHDPLASAVCILTDPTLAASLQAELEEQCGRLPRASIASRSLIDWGAIVVVPTLTDAVGVANRIAPEHLELSVRDPWSVLPFVKNAGAVFMGHYSPEPVGDYFAGPNHVLPTLGTARFSSALSVQTFCKKTSILCASREFLKESKSAIAELARLEGLEAHARSVESR